MTDEMHPEVLAVLRQARRLQSVMDDQLEKMAKESFTASDDTDTVEVTLNGHHWLRDVYIQDGLLRLGAPTVEDRVNEALEYATTEAAASIDADRERIDAVVAEITAEIPGHSEILGHSAPPDVVG
ncbi:MAG: YbaB/EbfC family nucleoid-associated protein [Mycolicibacterium sp.]|uniref:YbaB/EbfC family nucleoid-associated protein n=1 Tax=Mycolicibacterium sp. TaxID=2320850 RepID=UPI003D0B685B